MVVGLTHGEAGQRDGEGGVRQAQQERCRTESVLCGQPARGHRGQRHRAIAGGLIESHRQAALLGPDEVDLHDDRRRPGEPLVDAEQDVGEEPADEEGELRRVARSPRVGVLTVGILLTEGIPPGG